MYNKLANTNSPSVSIHYERKYDIINHLVNYWITDLCQINDLFSNYDNELLPKGL